MLKKKFVALLLVASVLPGLSQASITNGDFSAVDGFGNPVLDPWIPNSPDLVFINDYGQAAFREDEYLVSGGISSLTQMIDITAAQQLSFDYTMESFGNSPPTSDTFSVYLGGVEIFSINNDALALLGGGTFSETRYIDVSSFVSSNIELRFELLSDDDNYSTSILLDNVVLSDISTPVVPVPPAVLLGGIGVAAVSWLRRRRVM